MGGFSPVRSPRTPGRRLLVRPKQPALERFAEPEAAGAPESGLADLTFIEEFVGGVLHRQPGIGYAAHR